VVKKRKEVINKGYEEKERGMQKRRKTGSGSHPENMFGGGTRPGCAQKKTQRIELGAAKDYK
jgi:hypothetical protein